MGFQAPKKGAQIGEFETGAPNTNRTCDLPLRRGLLYPLSYRGAAAKLSHAGVIIEPPNDARRTMAKVTIYHNPQCGTSRNALALIRDRGEEPEVIEYLRNPPSRERLLQLIAEMGITARDLLRRKGTPYDELGLDDPALTDEQLVDAMLAHPILINRPIVKTPAGTRLCRPSETVLEILPDKR
jgi:arsenate reductase (glutaredoxin)